MWVHQPTWSSFPIIIRYSALALEWIFTMAGSHTEDLQNKLSNWISIPGPSTQTIVCTSFGSSLRRASVQALVSALGIPALLLQIIGFWVPKTIGLTLLQLEVVDPGPLYTRSMSWNCMLLQLEVRLHFIVMTDDLVAVPRIFLK